MTEEPQEQPEGQEQDQSKPEIETKPKPANLPKEEGWDLVEMSPEIQARFNRLYGQMKSQDRALKEMGEITRNALEKLEKFEEQSTKEKADSKVESLNTRLAEALEAGDYKLAARLQTDLVEAKMGGERPKPEPKSEQATEQFKFEPDQEAEILAWAGQKDNQGNPLRPWADPGHPQHSTATGIAAQVLERLQSQGLPLNQILTQMDQAVNAYLNPSRQQSSPQSAVLPSDSNTRPKSTKKASLSRDQELIAQAMGVDPEKYMKWSKLAAE